MHISLAMVSTQRSVSERCPATNASILDLKTEVSMEPAFSVLPSLPLIISPTLTLMYSIFSPAESLSALISFSRRRIYLYSLSARKAASNMSPPYSIHATGRSLKYGVRWMVMPTVLSHQMPSPLVDLTFRRKVPAGMLDRLMRFSVVYIHRVSTPSSM